MGESEICPQCNQLSNNQSHRLIQDTCGHKKCRLCLLNDEDSCKQCSKVQRCQVISFSTKPTKTANEMIKDSQGLLNLPKHLIANTNQTTFTCTVCTKTLNTTKSNIKYHTYCSGIKKPHECDTCKKQFILKSHLETHLLGHENKKPYSCDKCDKKFFERSKLNRHKTVHLINKLFICTNCGKSFKNKENLRTHSIIHGKEKPYKCTKCQASFNHSSNLKKHFLTHSSEKHHMCDQCGKSFKIKWALTVHRKNHSTERANTCKVCMKSFTHAKDLARHKAIHVDVKEYTCGICKTSFRRKDNLKRHTRNTHPGKEAEIIRNEINNHENDTSVIVDHPNAINVITSTSKMEATNKKDVGHINGPLKLVFKTSAFKNIYNIHRDYEEPEDDINIYERILNPSSQKPKQIATTSDAIKEEDTTLESQKIFAPFSGPVHYETSFFNTKHAVIKNMKFKLPAKYTKLKSNDVQKTRDQLYFDENNKKTYHQLENVTPVIVNTMNNNDRHWRKRTAHHLDDVENE